jgi:hypothetical protein
LPAPDTDSSIMTNVVVNFRDLRQSEVRRIILLGTRVNKGWTKSRSWRIQELPARVGGVVFGPEYPELQPVTSEPGIR